MYFIRKLSIKNLLKYLGSVTLYLWVGFLLLKIAGIISFPFSADLFAASFMFFVESCVLYAFIQILRDVLKAEYHEEIKEYHKRLEHAGYKMMT